MKRKHLIPLLCLSAMLATGCRTDDKTQGVDCVDADVTGLWQRDNSQEYWRYDSGHYGETWDLSDDVHEGEGTQFSWSLEGSALHIELNGAMGQVVPYDYTIMAMSSTTMVLREDMFSIEKTYHRP